MPYPNKEEAIAAVKNILLTSPQIAPMVVIEWPPEEPTSWTFLTKSLADMAQIAYQNDCVVWPEETYE
jgi:hypothetical protein